MNRGLGTTQLELEGDEEDGFERQFNLSFSYSEIKLHACLGSAHAGLPNLQLHCALLIMVTLKC